MSMKIQQSFWSAAVGIRTAALPFPRKRARWKMKRKEVIDVLKTVNKIPGSKKVQVSKTIGSAKCKLLSFQII